jgi:hypothetical protein
LIHHSSYLKKKSFHLLEGTMNTRQAVLFENLKAKNARNRSIFHTKVFLTVFWVFIFEGIFTPVFKTE